MQKRHSSAKNPRNISSTVQAGEYSFHPGLFTPGSMLQIEPMVPDWDVQPLPREELHHSELPKSPVSTAPPPPLEEPIKRRKQVLELEDYDEEKEQIEPKEISQMSEEEEVKEVDQNKKNDTVNSEFIPSQEKKESIEEEEEEEAELVRLDVPVILPAPGYQIELGSPSGSLSWLEYTVIEKYKEDESWYWDFFKKRGDHHSCGVH